jgi:integrase
MATFVKYEGKRGTSWMVRVRKNGKSITETFPTKKLGQEWATKIEHEIIEQAHFPERKAPTYHTMGELIDLYTTRVLPQLAEKTQRHQKILLNWWKAQLGDTNVSNITVRLMEDYKHLLLAKHQPSTVNNYLFVLSAPLTYAASDALGWINVNPMLKVKKFPQEGRVPVLSDNQIQALLYWTEQYGKPHLGLFTRLALGTGGRSGEILNLRWKQINFKRHTLTFVKTKNKKDRTIPLDEGLITILKDYYDRQFSYDEDDIRSFNDNSEEYIFLNAQTGKPIGNLRWGWNRATQKAGLSWLHPHDLRHVFCTKMVEKTGCDVLVLAELLGHSNPRMVMKYRHIGSHQYSDLIEKMADAVFKKK